MKRKTARLISFFPAFILLIFISCASSKAGVPSNPDNALNHSFKDGTYYFSRFYSLEFYDFYPPDTEFSIRTDKNSYGNAVFIKNCCFLEPEFQFSIQINDDFSVSSDENLSVSGYAEKDGRIHFSALVGQNGRTYFLTEHCLLLWHGNGTESEHKRFDGKYELKNSSGEKLEFDVSGGIYRGNFQGTLNSDGTFYNGYSQTTAISMGKAGNSCTSLDFREEGTFISGGGLELKSYLTTSTGFGTNKSRTVYSSTNVSSISRETPESLLSRRGKTVYSPYSPDKNIPGWYEFGVKSDEKHYYACGTSAKDDRETAVKLAKIYALNEISSFLGTKSSSKTEISSKNQKSGNKSYSSKEAFQNGSTISKSTLEYETAEDFFDSRHGRAYVKIKVRK